MKIVVHFWNLCRVLIKLLLLNVTFMIQLINQFYKNIQIFYRNWEYKMKLKRTYHIYVQEMICNNIIKKMLN